MATIDKIIKKNKLHVFRRLYMRRRINGDYESTWQRIPDKYILKWGSVNFSISDVKINFYRYSGLTIQVTNDDGYFSDTNEQKSFFYGADTRFKTFVKIEAGYTDTDGSEYPTVSTIYLGLIDENFSYNEKNELPIPTKHITSVFEEIPARDIPGLNVTLTASQIIEKIRDYTDANSVTVFQKYISLAAWYITATTNYYNLVTSSSLESLSCWELMKKLAGAENYVVYVNKSGNFYFRDNTPITTTAIYHFHGLGDKERVYGHNVSKRIKVDEGIKKVYNKIMVKYAEADTLSSYAIKQESWAYGDSSSSNYYGVRVYNYDNTFIPNSAAADNIATTIFNEYYRPKTEITIDGKFVPQLNLNDRCSLTYQTKVNPGQYLWGYAVWGDFVWGEAKGYNINIANVDFRVISVKHSLDRFSSNIALREI